jgi:hypothetical protein
MTNGSFEEAFAVDCIPFSPQMRVVCELPNLRWHTLVLASFAS